MNIVNMNYFQFFYDKILFCESTLLAKWNLWLCQVNNDNIIPRNIFLTIFSCNEIRIIVVQLKREIKSTSSADTKQMYYKFCLKCLTTTVIKCEFLTGNNFSFNSNSEILFFSTTVNHNIWNANSFHHNNKQITCW